MIKLLINDSKQKGLLNETSFGGLPVKVINSIMEWPKCKSCTSEMKYQGKIKTNIGLELIFMCENDPGMCDEWSPDEGGNKVIIVNNESLEYFNPENKEIGLRETEYGVKIIETAGENYDEARENWKGNKREILGSLFGEPEWIQNDETPNCDCCNKGMRFVSQLEEGPDHKTAMNFGGAGVGYLFDCEEGKTAKFLWQC
ncbi:hypothetical protein [Cellulophaga sp. L1A9]|uniref:hypothetical protein n=1 Tax=Cellulophaga sp. L1A9 TaxID=2686362 RepID=UPI00131E67CA|nr:hypothetical protein [Cellulophaga sp. L1A9]